MTPLPLTPEQSAIATSLARPGLLLVGQIMREQWTGDNLETTGRLVLHIGTVPESAQEGMRQAILDARAGRKRRRKKL